jgi:hypothetical protein
MGVENSAVLPSSVIGWQALESTEFQAVRSASFHGQSEDYSDFSAASRGILTSTNTRTIMIAERGADPIRRAARAPPH